MLDREVKLETFVFPFSFFFHLEGGRGETEQEMLDHELETLFSPISL